MHGNTHIPGAGNGSHVDHKRNNYAIQKRKFSQYIARSARKSRSNTFFEINFPQNFLYIVISFFVYFRTMSSENISETLNFVPDIVPAEKLLHQHEVETTTSFVMYYSNSVGKGKSKVRGAPQMNSGYEREC